MKISVRMATMRELDVLVAHRRGMFEAMGVGDARSLAQQDGDFRRWVRPRLKRGEFIGFIAESGKRPVAGGSVWLQERQPRPGFRGGKLPYLLSVFTEPEFRGRGLATKIVRAAMAWCREKGYESMTLHASKMGRAIYEKLGWERTWEMNSKLGRRRGSSRM
jgi:GNAT superfamily N-acetyltransferase